MSSFCSWSKCCDKYCLNKKKPYRGVSTSCSNKYQSKHALAHTHTELKLYLY